MGHFTGWEGAVSLWLEASEGRAAALIKAEFIKQYADQYGLEITGWKESPREKMIKEISTVSAKKCSSDSYPKNRTVVSQGEFKKYWQIPGI